MSEVNSSQGDDLILLGDSLPPDEVPISITSNDGKKVRKFIFGPLDAETLRGYRQRLSGIGRRKGDSMTANVFVFDRLFVRIDGLDPEEQERLSASGKSAKDVFLKPPTPQGTRSPNKRYAILIDNVTTRYMNEVYNLGEVTEDIKE